jgi:tetratricopeptide (TPR) repeat protein
LRAAGAVEGEAKGTDGDERSGILERAAAAYAKVALDFASEPAAVAQASFAAAEIWRRQGDLAKAGPLYERSLASDPVRYEERSLFELAHIARRNEESTEAIDLYGRVAQFRPDSARAHDSRMWIAKIHAGVPSNEEALAAFRIAVQKAGTPRRTIDACNGVANLQVKLGKLDEAQAEVDRAALASKSTEGDTESLAKAYEAMSARRALQRAKDKRDGAHRDAVQVEKGIRRGSRR